jgi:uncharacterized protein (UPF0332 family)
MTPQAARFLNKARQLLSEAETMLRVGLNEAAGRTAYLAAFHAAQASIFERTGKVLKTHAGVQTEFLKLTRDDLRVDGDLRGFLSRAYNLKALADYETGSDATLSDERAAAAVETGKRFIAHFAGLIATADGSDGDSSP